ncbi:MAG: MaoC family dehydratase N-terminal domain-containing protein [Burkholderiales bacterium]|nr:MaoC family dehydratase N-terminal domain-containing protein [Burkholderiales bacterium]
MTEEAAEGTITPEALAAARALIGRKLRPEQYLRDASVDSLTIFANGIGDLNPLFRDVEYARFTRFGGLIAHPCFPWTHHWPGRSYWGLAGVHGFGVAIDCEFYRNLRPGDRTSIWNRVLDVREKESRFSGRMVMQYLESTYVNQRDEVLCRALGLTARHERRASRERGKYREVKTHVYAPEERARIDRMVMTEGSRIRGGEPRYWEEVEVGEAIDEIARGPLSLSDTMAFVIGSGRGAAHGALLRHAAKHPRHYIRNKRAGGGIEYTGIGHHREDFAKEVGVPGMYDYLPQRACWFATAVTNWMGDDAVLKRLRMEARMFNCQGDTTFIGGKVARKYVKDRCALIDIEMRGVNQRGELTSPGFATVMLPSLDTATRIPLDGAVVDLELPAVR